MKTYNVHVRSLAWIALACISTLAGTVHAQGTSSKDQTTEIRIGRGRYVRHNNDVVTVGGNSTLESGKSADAVVSVFGSSTSAGDASNAVVSIFGNSRVTGHVGDSVVAVAGNDYVDSKVDRDVVAVFGDVELGPDADIGRDVVVIAGAVKRDPAAVIHGHVQSVLPGLSGAFDWLHPWIVHGLLRARPLAIAPGLGWAWGLALGFLALYVLLAVLFRGAIYQCVATLETQPGRSLLAALLATLLTPVAFLILCVTIVGIAAVPFLAIGLFCVGLFGKAVVLAALGRRVTTRSGDMPFGQAPLAVLIGGVIVMGLYLIPIVGFIVYKLLGIIGLGVVVYTLILAGQASRHERISGTPAAGAAPSPTGPTLAAAAPQATAASAPTHEGGLPPEPSAARASAAVDASVLPRAGFWIRIGAILVDALLVAIVLGVMRDRAFGARNVELLTLAAYAAVMWKLKGTTVGGAVFNVKVARVDGRPIDWSTAIVRALGCFLSLAVVGLGFLWIVFDDGKQAWHDKIAGTVVVRVPKGVPLL
jgi:uncharacterized RDD family membrane protein YckC